MAFAGRPWSETQPSHRGSKRCEVPTLGPSILAGTLPQGALYLLVGVHAPASLRRTRLPCLPRVSTVNPSGPPAPL